MWVSRLFNRKDQFMIGGLLTLLLVSACASPSPNLMKPPAEGDPVGTVIYKLTFPNPSPLAFGRNQGALVAIRKVGSQEHFYTFAKDPEFTALTLPPGKYQFALFSDKLSVRLQEPISEAAYDPAHHIPVRPFEVRAGQATYLGDLTVEGLANDRIINGPRKGVRFTVSDDSIGAREMLKTSKPDLAQRMTTELFVVDQ